MSKRIILRPVTVTLYYAAPENFIWGVAAVPLRRWIGRSSPSLVFFPLSQQLAANCCFCWLQNFKPWPAALVIIIGSFTRRRLDRNENRHAFQWEKYLKRALWTFRGWKMDMQSTQWLRMAEHAYNNTNNFKTPA